MTMIRVEARDNWKLRYDYNCFFVILYEHSLGSLSKINISIGRGRKVEGESKWNRLNLEELWAQMKGKLIVTWWHRYSNSYVIAKNLDLHKEQAYGDLMTL